MEKATKLILAIVIIGIILGFLLNPAMLVVAGAALWIILWLAQGGMVEGNPYKRMTVSKLPSFVLVNQYQKNQEIEVRDSGKSSVF
ncbi:MAG: hypothetical protein Q7J68_07255 [Thermoplasmata archaeon]|nr:hypothetical protein [Thermoplasmata archaeon]